MSRIDSVFFGTDGVCLTSTSANHIANLAKEFVRGHLRDLEGMHFVEKRAGSFSSDLQAVLQKGAGAAELESVGNKLTEISEANSLIAWLREAIKAKNDFLDRAKNATREDYCEWEGIDPKSVSLTLPSFEDFYKAHGFASAPEEPECEEDITADEVVDGWEEADRLRYRMLEKQHSGLSSLISGFSSTVQEVADAVSCPLSSKEADSQTLVCEYAPTVRLEEVKSALSSMADKRAQIANALTEYQRLIEKAIREDHKAKETEFLQQWEAYEQSLAEFTLLKDRFDHVVYPEAKAAVSAFDGVLAEYRVRKAKEVGNLKIIIPSSLREIFGKVSSLGK